MKRMIETIVRNMILEDVFFCNWQFLVFVPAHSAVTISLTGAIAQGLSGVGQDGSQWHLPGLLGSSEPGLGPSQGVPSQAAGDGAGAQTALRGPSRRWAPHWVRARDGAEHREPYRISGARMGHDQGKMGHRDPGWGIPGQAHQGK